jgi:hypothetical protein
MGSGGERGQATVEWIGLLLLLSLAFGAVLMAVRGAGFGGPAHRLGEVLAGGITCAARDACRAEAAAMRELRGRSPRDRARDLRAWTSAPPEPFGRRGIRPSAPWERGPRGLRGLDGANSSVLRALGRAGRHAGEFGWLACLGYQQWRYDYEHPRSPREAMPAAAVMDELNTCFNPIGWLLP